MKITIKTVLIPLVLSLLFAGCAGAPVKERPRIFYPSLPDKPRIEYIGYYRSQHDFPKTPGQLRKEMLLGQDPPFAFGRPINVASCGDGRVFISDTLKDKVSIYDFNKNTIHYLAEDANFQNPTGLAADADCNIYVVNTKRKMVYVYDKNEKPSFSFGGDDLFEWPVGVAVDAERGRIYVTDVRKHDVLAFDMKGNILYSMLEKAGKDADPVEATFNFPVDVDVASDGRVVVLDSMNARVKVYSPEGDFQAAWGRRGDSGQSFGLIKGLAIDSEDNIYVTDADSNSVKIFDIEGNPLTSFGSEYRQAGRGVIAAAGFYLISGIDVDPKGGIFIADQLAKSFQVFQFLTDEYLKDHPLPVYSPKEVEKGAGWDEKNKPKKGE